MSRGTALRIAATLFALLLLGVPRRAAAEYWCQKEDLHIVGVAPDGRIVSYTQKPGGGADCDFEAVEVRDASGTSRPLLEVSRGLGLCERWKVVRGQYALVKPDHKLGVVELAKKIAKSLNATAPTPSKRPDLFTVYTSSVFDESVPETNTIAYLRWDGEPVASAGLANYGVATQDVQLFEHPAVKGLFVSFDSTDPEGRKTSECGAVHYDWYLSPVDLANASNGGCPKNATRRKSAGL